MHRYAILLLSVGLSACNSDQRDKNSAPGSGQVVENIRITALPVAWSMTGFSGDKDISGMAAWNATMGLVCSDELLAAQSARIDHGAHIIKAGALIPLLTGITEVKTEFDAEAVAVSHEDNAYYVTGSHGVGKKKGDFEPSRCHVARIPVDPQTGEPDTDHITVGSLMPWLENDPVMKSHLREPLQLNGFNIEGLTVRNGKLWFGVRGPNLQGDAFVIETDAKSLFSGKPVATLHQLAVGSGEGIREIAAIQNGFLILTGNACAEASKKHSKTMARRDDNRFQFFLWNPASKVPLTPLGGLPAPSAKAEGLLILSESPETIEVLVLFDSAAGGGPKAYRIQKIAGDP